MENLTLEQALEILLKRVDKIEEKEELPLWDAVGRVLAEDAVAKKDQPPFPRSPLDGYAVRSEDITEASEETPVFLKVIGEVTAGHVFRGTVEKKTAVRIMTGAPIPEGADCVIRQEDTDYGEDEVAIFKPIKAFQNYCMQGEDYKAGTRLLDRGTRLGAVEIGILASLGYAGVGVYRRPKVALLTTGDEIVLPKEGRQESTLPEGKIYDSNLYTLGARLRMWDMEVPVREQVGDDAVQMAERIRRAAQQADLIITTGGVSVGKKDIMHEVIKLLPAERLFWRIAVKPGMPTLCAVFGDKPLICLSGNPFGATVNLELLVKPLLQKLTGRKDLKLQRKKAVLESSFLKPSPVTRYVRACYEQGHVTLTSGSNDSGILSSMTGCNCLMEIPAGTEKIEKGESVWVVML